MRWRRLAGFLVLLFARMASSRSAVLQQTKQIRTVREASGNVPGEVEGSGVTLEKTDASGSFPGNAKDVINRNITLGSGTLKNVAKVENTKGPTGPLNVGPNESKGAGMNLPERAPKVPPQVPLSSAPDKPVKPAVGIISGPSLGKPLGTALAGRPSVQAKQLEPFEQDCLEAHNNYRARHGVPPLMWSDELAESAQKWADQLASNDLMQHDQVAISNKKLGENLAYFKPSAPKCERAVISNCVMCREMIQRWYNEIKNYDFDKGTSKSPKTSYKHFSQIVWANTTELGVGTAISNKYGFITVARYKPMGNEGGVVEFIKNVPPEGGPLPTVTPSLGDTLPQSNSAPSPSESSKPEIPSSEPVHSENDVKSAAPTVLSPETVNKQALQPEKTHSNQTKNQGPTTEVAKQPVPTRKGFVHTITAADGTKAQVYLSKSGGHAGIVFRDQIFRAHPSEETIRAINVL